MPTCKGCGRDLPESEFESMQYGSQTRRYTRCRPCMKAYRKMKRAERDGCRLTYPEHWKSTDWMSHAECRGMDSRRFFEVTGSLAAVRKVCARCRVRLRCLRYALATEADLPTRDHRHGVWGGTTPIQRYLYDREGWDPHGLFVGVWKLHSVVAS